MPPFPLKATQSARQGKHFPMSASGRHYINTAAQQPHLLYIDMWKRLGLFQRSWVCAYRQVDTSLKAMQSVITDALLAKKMRDLDLEEAAQIRRMREKFPDGQAEPRQRRLGLLDGPAQLSIKGVPRHNNDKANFRSSTPAIRKTSQIASS